MELMELGPLHRYLYKYGRRDVSWDEKHSIAVDIAKGMSFIHSTNPPLIHRGPYGKPIGAKHMPGAALRVLPILAHRPSQTIPFPTDLKSPNILLTQSPDKPFPTAKIADFGLSRGLEFSKEYLGSVVDNPTWLAPEVIKQQSYNQSVDVYAFGVILYEIAMQQAFFSGTSFLFEVEEKVCRGERPEISPGSLGV
jgi:serine/threonine protein kinase